MRQSGRHSRGQTFASVKAARVCTKAQSATWVDDAGEKATFKPRRRPPITIRLEPDSFIKKVLGDRHDQLPFSVPDDSWLHSVGNTPVWRIDENIWAKIEGLNRGGSIKDRAMLGMILNMFIDGRLHASATRGNHQRSTLCLTTSGSAGVSLALIQQALENDCGADIDAVIVIPKAYKHKRACQRIMEMGVPVFEDQPGHATGCQLLMLDGDFMSVLSQSKLIAEREGWTILDQHHDINSMGAHQTTAQELLAQLPGLTDVVCATGTGATAAGLREFLPSHITVHSRAAQSGVIDGLSNIRRYDNFCDAGRLAGYDEGLFDAQKSKSMQAALLADHGLEVGASTGATGYLAVEVAQNVGPDGVVAFISACGTPVAHSDATAVSNTATQIAEVGAANFAALPSTSLPRSCATLGRPLAALGRPDRPSAVRGIHTEAAMAAKGLQLPAYQDAMWSYVKGIRDGQLLYIGDHVGQNGDAVTVRGKVGEGGTVTPEEAKVLAGQAVLRLLATASHYLDGDLDRIDQVIKLTGIVNGVPDFQGHGNVVDGASDMMIDCLGERGKHARTCIGAGSCPAAVTVEAIIRVKDGF